MKKEVIISVIGSREGEAPSVVTSRGDYFIKDGMHYLFFEEQDEESRSIIKNRIRMNECQVEIKKSGAVASHMIFQIGNRHAFMYQTPYGDIRMVIDTKMIKLRETEKEIEMQLSYHIFSEEEMVSDNKVQIKIIEKSSMNE